MTQSAFEKYQAKAWPIKFRGQLHLPIIAGGVPTEEKVVEGWLKAKLKPSDDLLREAVAKTMEERGVNAEEASKIVADARTLNGFKRDPEKGLYVEGRQLKAALKEAVSVAVAAGKIQIKGWGETKKWITGYFPEHVFVVEDRLYLGVDEPTDVLQKFVHSRFGAAISYEEVVHDAKISFTIETDHNFTEEQWAMVWLTGERQGLGASRSQGFGRYTVTSWERLT